MAQPAVYKGVWSVRVLIKLLTFAGWPALAMVAVTANAQSPVYIESQKVLENFGKQGLNAQIQRNVSRT